MSLLDEFESRYVADPTDPARKIVFGLLDELFSRRGFDDVWDAMDRDAKEKLLAELLEQVSKHLPAT